jgi:hypothetical protein
MEKIESKKIGRKLENLLLNYRVIVHNLKDVFWPSAFGANNF